MKLGLALSGGGIRGIAHAGVLKALEENNIKIDAIGGTSSGSIISTLYAMGYSPYYIYILFIFMQGQRKWRAESPSLLERYAEMPLAFI